MEKFIKFESSNGNLIFFHSMKDYDSAKISVKNISFTIEVSNSMTIFSFSRKIEDQNDLYKLVENFESFLQDTTKSIYKFPYDKLSEIPMD